MSGFGLSGFTFCRNAVALGYPLRESIESILPIVDEFVVALGPSDDGTGDLLEKIGSPKIRIVESAWDENQTTDARVLSAQGTFALSHCRFPWAFHLQADEVIHEEDLPRLQALMREHHGNRQVLGFMFRFIHFLLDYRTVNPWAFRREVRIVRNDGQLRSAGDSCGFARKSDGLYLGKKLLGREVLRTGARVFHYSSVMPRSALEKKISSMSRIRYGDPPAEVLEEMARNGIVKLERQYSIMKEYRGSHPSVMRERIAASERFRPRVNRLLNWRFYANVFAHGFKG
ncbi:MAG: glycosyltransferase family protein [Desulfobacteria bacterium]